jgi:hypothetical protein
MRRIRWEHFWEQDETGFDGIWTGSTRGSQIGVRHQLRNWYLLYRRGRRGTQRTAHRDRSAHHEPGISFGDGRSGSIV